jgi:uncharacterized protein (UPF0212 family)
MAHKGHPTGCDFTSKAACEKARRIAIGQCVSMVAEDRQCIFWGIDKVDDRPYCGQHLNSVYLAADEARRNLARRTEINGRIDTYIAAEAARQAETLIWWEQNATPEMRAMLTN